MSSTVLVIPCYNEAARLDRAAIDAFQDRTTGVHLLFVDDGSRDATREVLAGLCEAVPRCRLLPLPRNHGKAEAVRAGLLAAVQLRPDFIGYWDADLATPLEALRDFIAVLERRPHVNLVLGSRVQLLGRSILRGRARHYIGRLFATAVSLMLRLRVYDTQCGAKLFRRTDTLPALFAEPFMTRWVFDVEILARLIRDRGGDRAAAAAQLYEMPLMEWRDVQGSKVRWLDGFRAFVDVCRIWLRYLARTRRPRPLSVIAGGGRAS